MSEENHTRSGKALGPAWRLRGADAIAVVVMFVAVALLLVESSTRSLAFDELLAYLADSLATPQLVWRSLVLAPLPVDPPLYHLLEHYVIQVFGTSELAVRLLSMAGMLVALWLVYVFTRRAGGRIAGLLAMSILIASGAFDFGYFARPYGVVLAATAGALVAWQNIVRGWARLPSLICFGVCLGIANLSHYYSILIIVPFAIGELVRIVRTRKIDWPLIIAAIAGYAVELVTLPFLPAARAYRTGIWRGVRIFDIPLSYRMFFPPWQIVIPLFIVLAALYAVKWNGHRASKRRGVPIVRTGLRVEEAAALFAFALYPLVVFALSMTVTHTFAERYTLPAIFGLSILPAMALRALVNRDGILLTAAAVILCFPAVTAAQSVRKGRAPQKPFTRRYAAVLNSEAPLFDRLPETSKIVMTDPVLFIKSLRYAPAPVRRRIELLDLDPSPTLAGRKDTGDLVVLGLRIGIGAPVITESELNSQRDPFFFVCCATKDFDSRIRSVLQNSNSTQIGTYGSWPVYVTQLVRPGTNTQ